MTSHDQTVPLSECFESLCRNSDAMPDVFDFLARTSASRPQEIVDVVLIDLTEGWRRGTPRPAQEYFQRLPFIANDWDSKSKIIEHDFQLQQETGDGADVDSYLMQFPGMQSELRINLTDRPTSTPLTQETAAETPSMTPPLGTTRRPRTALSPPVATPQTIGRYAIRGVLGSGAFGTVYDAYDESLQRAVAIKQPKQTQLSEFAMQTFQTEARHLARLHHPGIVPVYDFGVTADGKCFVVARKIAGQTLAEALRRQRFSIADTIDLIAQVCEALHYAHCEQIVHRDVKPANILLDQTGKPYVADFGLALHEEEQRLVDQRAAGTPAYMPPEQVRGEMRFLDGRADIWSVGVMLYEMLTGQRPFRGETTESVIGEVLGRDAKPLRVIKPEIPQQLEQICLRCLEKDKTRRFATAADLAMELRQCLQPVASLPPPAVAPDNLRVVSLTADQEEGFPIVACTLMNRTSEPLVIVSIRVEVLDFQSLRGRTQTRELVPTSRIDIVLPPAPGSSVTPLKRPVFLSEKDAVCLEFRMVCSDPEGRCRSPHATGKFKYRLVLMTDVGLEATTDELTTGRGT